MSIPFGPPLDPHVEVPSLVLFDLLDAAMQDARRERSTKTLDDGGAGSAPLHPEGLGMLPDFWAVLEARGDLTAMRLALVGR